MFRPRKSTQRLLVKEEKEKLKMKANGWSENEVSFLFDDHQTSVDDDSRSLASVRLHLGPGQSAT